MRESYADCSSNIAPFTRSVVTAGLYRLTADVTSWKCALNTSGLCNYPSIVNEPFRSRLLADLHRGQYGTPGKQATGDTFGIRRHVDQKSRKAAIEINGGVQRAINRNWKFPESSSSVTITLVQPCFAVRIRR